MFSLLSIFVIVPLIYSHTFARLGEAFVIENGIGNFESVKVSIFFLLLFLSTVEFLLGKKEFLSRKTSQVSLILITFVIFEFFFFGPESLFGIGEKQHGSLFFAGLFWFGYLFTLIERSSFLLFQKAIILTALFVSFSAALEYLFSYNLFMGYIDDVPQSWGNGRATATLGNPNYVAGYLLMVLPLLLSLKNTRWKYSALALIFLGIISTGSFIGMAISGFYIFFIILKKRAKKNAIWIFLVVVGVVLTALSMSFIGSEKWLSLVSRFVLMKETLTSIFHDIGSILIGKGPNGIIEFYNGERSQEIMNYFPSSMTIDSSHNIFIDLFVKFGIFPILFLIYILKKNWKLLESWQKHGILLSFFFLSLNVVVLSHYLVFCFYFTRDKQRS